MRLLYKFEHKDAAGKITKLAIRKPTRLELDDADMMFSKFQSECIGKGILTKEMLIKAYKNFGGTLSNQEEKEYSKVFESFVEARKKIDKAKTKKEKDLLQKEVDLYYSSLRDIEMEHEHLFDRTADVIARNKTILHLALLMGLKDTSEEKDADPVFESVYSGEEFEDRYNDFAEKEEADSDIANAVLSRISLFVTFWYYGDKTLTEEDFKKYDELTRSDFDGMVAA